jgi:hypothetical protein
MGTKPPHFCERHRNPVEAIGKLMDNAMDKYEDAMLKEFYKPSSIEFKDSNPKDLIGSNKVPLSLVPGTTKVYLALGHMEGHLKYGLVNWRETGVKCSVYLDALERHIEKFKNGEWEDPTTGVPHLANALACLSIIVDAYHCGKLVDDRPKSAPVADLIDFMSEKVVKLKELFGGSKPTDYFIDGPRERE